MFKFVYLGIIGLLTLFVASTRADVHPRVEEALQRETLPDGFVFDVQSNNPKYYEQNLDYLTEQIRTIYAHSPKLKVILLSRGREMKALLTSEYATEAYRTLKRYYVEYGLEIRVDIEVAAGLGYDEGNFSSFVSVFENAYLTIVSGRENNFVIIELARMNIAEKEAIKLSPTWRTDDF